MSERRTTTQPNPKNPLARCLLCRIVVGGGVAAAAAGRRSGDQYGNCRTVQCTCARHVPTTCCELPVRSEARPGLLRVHRKMNPFPEPAAAPFRRPCIMKSRKQQATHPPATQAARRTPAIFPPYTHLQQHNLQCT
ncbi:hypothetical protein PLESTF_001371900 [Pleodorina starrii]|nr:hypothetical protein PLESTF_001371900 [Pleodorina starrii]